MTLRHLKIFLAVCQWGCNTTRAAKALHTSQPAVSLAVKELEDHYGVRLFDRMGRRLSLTGAGQRMLEYASRVTAVFQDMEREMRDFDALGILRVGASMTIGTIYLPGYVKAFTQGRPGLTVHVSVGPTPLMEEKLLSNSLDLALTEGPVHSQALVSREYMWDYLQVICPPEFPWRQGETVTLEEFAAQPFALRERGSGTREVFDRELERAGLTVEPLWEATSTAALLNAVIEGLAIAVLPERLVESAVRLGQVTPIKVEGLDFKRSYYLVHHRDKVLSGSARGFMEFCLASGAEAEILGQETGKGEL